MTDNNTNASADSSGDMLDSATGLTVFENPDDTMSSDIDGAGDGSNGSTTADNNEELFELEAGKNSDGTPNIVKLNKADLLKFAGIGRTSAQKMNDVHTQEQQMTELARRLADPKQVWEVLAKLGHDKDAMVNAITEQQIADMMEDKDVKAARLEKEELMKFRRQEAETKKANEDKAATELAEGFTKRLDAKLTEVLIAAKLPNNGPNRSQLTSYLKTLMFDKEGKMVYQRPLLEIPMEKLVTYMKTSSISRLEALLEGADEDSILATLPQALQDRIAKAVSKRMQSGSSASKPSNKINNTPTKKDVDGPRKIKTVDEREEEVARTVAAAQKAWELRNGKRKN